MAIGGAFLGGGVELVPAGSCKLELEILTEDRANLTASFMIEGTSTYTVTAGADGRAVYTVPAGQTYTVSVNTTGYDNIASQTVIAESGTVRYVRFEAFSGRVKRSGDTMTGILSITSTSGTPRLYLKHPSLDITTTPSSNCFIDQEYLDKNGKRFALIEGLAGGNSSTRQIGLMINSSNGSDSDSWSRLQLTHDGSTAYATAPSWSVGTNDNSDKILTIKMANSLPSLVHTTGNETISGIKTFNTSPVVPSTLSGATGAEIATADWSLSKFQRKITYGTGDPPSGGQAGDIYIKI